MPGVGTGCVTSATTSGGVYSCAGTQPPRQDFAFLTSKWRMTSGRQRSATTEQAHGRSLCTMVGHGCP